MDENKKFEKGQFLTNSNKPGSFVIFEGIERDSTTVTKRYSVIANYEPSKYRELPNGTWGSHLSWKWLQTPRGVNRL